MASVVRGVRTTDNGGSLTNQIITVHVCKDVYCTGNLYQ